MSTSLEGLSKVSHKAPSTVTLDTLPKGVQLWAVKLPAGLKPKHLEGQTFQLGEASTFTVHKEKFVISDKKNVEGSLEMSGLYPLLPGKHNKYIASEFSHKIVIERAPLEGVDTELTSSKASLIHSQPSPVPGAVLSAQDLLKSPDDPAVLSKKRKREQPEGLLFRPAMAGLLSGSFGETSTPETTAAAVAQSKKTKHEASSSSVSPKKEKKDKKDKKEKKDKKVKA